MKTKKIKDNFFKRFFFKIWNLIDKDDILTTIEQLAFDIFEISLNDENNILYLNHGEFVKKYILTKTYLTDKKVNTFILLNSNSNNITIVNHQYKYDIRIPQKTCRKMDKMFNDRLNEDRERMEKEILSNTAESLETVLKTLKDNLI